MVGALKTIALLMLLPIIGSFAFMVVEGWSFLDSLYMAVITLTTVGFQEVHPLSNAGRILVIVYLIFGLGIFLFGVAQIGELIVRAELGNLLGRRKMEASIKKLNDHIIVCGYGRMGQALCRGLIEKNEKFVVIDKDPDRIIELQQEGMIYLQGDTTDDRMLVRAGADRAKGLAVVLSHDADNLYVVLSSRLLNKTMQIFSRASDELSEKKMLRAGADKVVSPYKSGAARMTQLLSNPNLNDFIEVFDSHGSEVDLAQIIIDEKSECYGKTLAESNFTRDGIVIVGIRKKGGKLHMPPHKDLKIELNDTLMAMGKPEAVENLIGNS